VGIVIINGPNLNLVGKRKVEIYGTVSFTPFMDLLRERFPGIPIGYFQTNHEGAIIDKLHEIGFSADGIILNPGGYTHTSVAIRDAIEAIETPVIEVHISDIYSREPFRQHSLIRDVCAAQIVGRGLEGYAEAVELLLSGRALKP
jgi:3-dehydroquinate dehydratase-2